MVRDLDPIVLTGASLAGLRGQDIASLRLYASRAGRLVAIPFQIDRRSRDGEYIFSEKNKGKGSGRETGLSDWDELVFMSADLGEMIRPNAPWPWPRAAGMRKGIEIEAADPVSHARGWAYLFAFEDPPEKSPVDYVSYDKVEDVLSTPAYSIGFKNPKVRTSLNYMALGGGDGIRVDIVDRFKARAEATFLWQHIRMRKTEGDFSSKVLDIHDGPVRVVRKSRYSVRILWKLPTPGAVAYTFFYRNSIELPTQLNVPFDVGYVVSGISSRVSLDFNREMTGARFFNPRNPRGLLIDGIMSPSELAMDHGEFPWLAIEGPDGAILMRVVMEDELPVTMTLFYRDDALVGDPPEEEPGQYGNLGWQLGNLEALKRGKYRYKTLVYFPDSLKPEETQPCLDVYDHPLVFRVSPFGSVMHARK